MHQALYRKWRPQTFRDVCGQEHITSILRYEAQEGSFSHAYLFCGSRGTGKTTCAKILAKAVNCEHPVDGNPCGECAACRSIDNGSATDVLEMDAASNNGVDNIRDIRDEVVYAPSTLKYRVYIIDEVHMLSASAFNALLKTLEEPPQHVVFILATTELHKLPATIISRCQRFDFRRISTEVLMNRLLYIAKEEGIGLSTDAARMLAKLAQGGMRDAISLFELCAGGRTAVDVDAVTDAVGITGRDAMLSTVWAIVKRDYDTLFGQIAEVVRSSKDLTVFWQDLIALYRDLLVVKTTPEHAASYLDLTDSETEQMKSLANALRKETLLYHCKLLEDALFGMLKANAVKRIVAEMTLVRMCDEALDDSREAILSRIAFLEEQMHTGAPRVAIAAPIEKDAPPATTPSAPHPTEAVPTKEPKKPTASPVTAVESPKTDEKVLRPMRNWMEIVDRVGRSDSMTASFLKAAAAYATPSGEILILCDNAFAINMLQHGAAKDKLRAALSAVLRQELSEDRIKILPREEQKQYSVIDELLGEGEEPSV